MKESVQVNGVKVEDDRGQVEDSSSHHLNGVVKKEEEEITNDQAAQLGKETQIRG